MQWIVWIGFFWSVVYIKLVYWSNIQVGNTTTYAHRETFTLDVVVMSKIPWFGLRKGSELAVSVKQYTYENLGFYGVWNNKNLFTDLIYLYALKREWSLRSRRPARWKFYNMQHVVQLQSRKGESWGKMKMNWPFDVRNGYIIYIGTKLETAWASWSSHIIKTKRTIWWNFMCIRFTYDCCIDVLLSQVHRFWSM